MKIKSFLIMVLSNQNIAYLLIDILTIIVFIPIYLIYLNKFNLKFKYKIQHIIGGLLTAVIIIFFMLSPWDWYFANFKSENIVLSILIFISVGMVEEITFRGMLYEYLKSKINIITAFFCSSILFGLIHLGNVLFGNTVTIEQIIGSILIGFIFCAVYQYFGIVIAIVLHTLYDVVMFNQICININNITPAIILSILSIIAIIVFTNKNKKLENVSS